MPSMTEIQIYEKVKSLEREISGMKIALLKSGMVKKNNQKLISLEGIWAGVEITEEDIKISQKSLFPQEYNL
ncbi:MAG: hypothetical protein R6V59_00950 [Dehalococcoidia bacterium]